MAASRVMPSASSNGTNGLAKPPGPQRQAEPAVVRQHEPPAARVAHGPPAAGGRSPRYGRGRDRRGACSARPDGHVVMQDRHDRQRSMCLTTSGGRRPVVLQHVLDEIDAAARRIEFVAEQHVGRAGRGAEAAMHAGAQDLLGFRDVRIGELCEREAGLHVQTRITDAAPREGTETRCARSITRPPTCARGSTRPWDRSFP